MVSPLSPVPRCPLPPRGEEVVAALVLGTAVVVEDGAGSCRASVEGPGLLSMATSVTMGVTMTLQGVTSMGVSPPPLSVVPLLTFHVRLHLLALREGGSRGTLDLGLDDEGALAAAQIHLMLGGEGGRASAPQKRHAETPKTGVRGCGGATSRR